MDRSDIRGHIMAISRSSNSWEQRTRQIVLCLGICLSAVCVPAVALAQVGTWTTKTPSPHARFGTAGSVINGRLYVVGGSGFGTNCCAPVTDVYDTAADTWSSAAPPPVDTANAGAGVINGLLYVVGGCINSDCIPGNTNLLMVYDPASNTWALKNPMPTARNSVAVGAIGGKLYVAGGQQQCGPCVPLTTLEVYDPASNSWETKTPLPIAQNAASAEVIDGRLYVIGGNTLTNGLGVTGLVQIYDPSTDTWTMGIPMPTPRAALRTGIVNGVLFAVGGFAPPTNQPLAVNEAFDPMTGIWTESTPMPTPRYGFVTGVANGTLYAVEGFNGIGTVATNEAFTPLSLPGLASLIASSGIQPGLANSLLAKVRAAEASQAAGNMTAACNQLGALENETRAQSGKRLTAAQATAIISATQAVQGALGCR